MELQNLCVPDHVGGECHVLLGIQYAAHFPRLVYTLETGLGIYEVRLQPSSPHCTAALAGPHSSFNLLAGKVGNVAFLLQKFNEGLSYWKSFGAPAPKSLPLSHDEYDMAFQMNRQELKGYDACFEEESAVTGSYICLTHAATATILHPVSDTPSWSTSSFTVTPMAPLKKSRDVCRSRMTTDTRDDLLDVEERPSLIYSCSNHLDDDQSCIPLKCCECSLPVNIDEEASRELLDDLLKVHHYPFSGNPICIVNDKYRSLAILLLSNLIQITLL